MILIRFCWIIVEIMLQLFFSWTIAYHFSILVNLQARLISIPFSVLFSLLFIVSLKKWLRSIKIDYRSACNRGELWYLIGGLCLAATSGAFTIYISKPNADDFSFFHRALVQLANLNIPFILTDTTHNVPGLPPTSFLHSMTSYEPFVAMAAAVLGIDPLWAYQNGSAFVVGAMLPIVYILLYRQFGLRIKWALAASMLALLFLIIDGNQIRSFGNFGLVRCWQGKVIDAILIMPLTFLLAYRFLRKPGFSTFYMVFMAAVCGVGLSSSGIFMVTILVFAVSVTHLLSYGISIVRLRDAFILNLATIYCVMFGIGLTFGYFPRPAYSIAWVNGWPATWWLNLGFVIGDKMSLLRDGLILTALPFVVLGKLQSRFLLLLTFSLIAAFANPIMGPFWMKYIQPAVYWRFMYLFPLPWCSGLFACSLIHASNGKRYSFFAWCLLLSTALTISASFQASILAESTFKPPREYKFQTKELNVSRLASNLLSNKNLLAPEELVDVLGLLNPSIKFEATRETMHKFGNANQVDEGTRRCYSRKFIVTGEVTDVLVSAFRQSISNGVNAIMLRTSSLPTVKQALPQESKEWMVVRLNGDYVLLLRQI